MEYGTDVDEFLDTIYQAGMDVERDLASEKERADRIVVQLSRQKSKLFIMN